MKYEVETKDAENLTYGVWNNDIYDFQFVSEWNDTETLNLSDANTVCDRLNFNESVELWVRIYKLTLPTVKLKKQRLKELQTWDKPRPDNESEHRAKKHALIHLTANY